jgi:ferredoxin
MIGCPAYEESSFEPLTAKGRNKALQAGLGARDMIESIDACTLCGYCDAVCPKEVRNVEIVLRLRRELNGGGPAAAPLSRPLVLGCTIRQRAPHLVPSILDFLKRIGRPAEPEPDGCCGSLDAEAGRARRAKVPAGVVADPVCLEHYDAEFLGELAMKHLDQFTLKPPFYYFVPHRIVNAGRSYALYDALRRASGCETNLDLNRLARSTTAGSVQGLSGPLVRGAVARLLRNSKAERIVTCSPADYLAFREHSGRETRFITECLR